MKKTVLFLGLLGMALVAQANIVPVAEFTGTFTEGWENPPPCPPCFYSSLQMFGDGSHVDDPTQAGLLVTSGWGFQCTIFPHGGSQLMGSAGGIMSVILNTPAHQIGAWFGTNCGYAGATAAFYDSSDNLLATLDVTAPADCSWTWNGWEQDDPSGPGIKRVDITGTNPYGGAFVDNDDWNYDPVSPPTGCRGDMNCDHEINFADIDPFVAILGGETPCNPYNADVNGDGQINFADIDPFVELLTSGATCP